MQLKCQPVSRKELKRLALEFRNKYLVSGLVFPVFEIIDNLYTEGLINLLIIDNDDSRLNENELALYDLNTNTFYIKLNVYEEASQGIGRSRFTLAHELSHYLLLYVLGYKIEEVDEKIKVYEDPEWQANYLAGELLAPENLTKNFTVDDYMNKCLLSEECSIVLWDKRRKDK